MRSISPAGAVLHEVLRRARVRAGCEADSLEIGFLEPGERVEVMERRDSRLGHKRVKVLFERGGVVDWTGQRRVGWTSVMNASGSVLLQPVRGRAAPQGVDASRRQSQNVVLLTPTSRGDQGPWSSATRSSSPPHRAQTPQSVGSRHASTPSLDKQPDTETAVAAAAVAANSTEDSGRIHIHNLQVTLTETMMATEAARRQAQRAMEKQTRAEIRAVRVRQNAEAGLRRRALRGVLRDTFRRWKQVMPASAATQRQTQVQPQAQPPPLPRAIMAQDQPPLHVSVENLQKVAEGLRRDVLFLRNSPVVSPASSRPATETYNMSRSRLDLTPGKEGEWQELLDHRRTPGAVGTTPLAPGEKRDLSQRWKSCGIRSQKIESLRQRMKAHSYGQSGQDPRKLFKHFDRDNTGELDFDEFKAAVRKVGRMTAKQITDKVRAARLKDVSRQCRLLNLRTVAGSVTAHRHLLACTGNECCRCRS